MQYKSASLRHPFPSTSIHHAQTTVCCFRQRRARTKEGQKLSPVEKDAELLEKLLKANKKLDSENEAVLSAYNDN